MVMMATRFVSVSAFPAVWRLDIVDTETGALVCTVATIRPVPDRPGCWQADLPLGSPFDVPVWMTWNAVKTWVDWAREQLDTGLQGPL
jgi:hypothetical protein